jgi:fibronectin-binding autotransporter adhesin
VTVLGGLTLNSGTLAPAGNTTIENSNGTGPGPITLNSDAELLFADNYTLYNLTLNGGSVQGALNGFPNAVTVGKGGLVQGYGNFQWTFGRLALDNDGTINSNVKDQTLYLYTMPFTNDGLILASGGGNISIDWNDTYAGFGVDLFSNSADGTISATDGGTLKLGGDLTNSGLISAVNSTAYFGDGWTHVAQNAGNIAVSGGELSLSGVTNSGLITAASSTVYFGSPAPDNPLDFSSQNTGDIAVTGGELFLGSLAGGSLYQWTGSQYIPAPYQWTDSGLIATVGTAIDVLGSGDISAGGTLSVVGGSLSGQGTLEDDGQITVSGGSIALSSLTIGAGERWWGTHRRSRWHGQRCDGQQRRPRSRLLRRHGR